MIKKKVLARIKSIPFLIKQAAPYYKVQFRTNNILVKIYIYRIVKQLRLHLLGIDPFRKCVLYISAVIQRHLLIKKHAYILETCLKGMAAVVQATYILVYWRARQLPHRHVRYRTHAMHILPCVKKPFCMGNILSPALQPQ